MDIKTDVGYLFLLLSIISRVLFVKAHGHRACRGGPDPEPEN